MGLISETKALIELLTGKKSLGELFYRPLSWKKALGVANVLLQKIESNWNPDVVIGLGRSGALWGGWLAGNLGTLPIAVVDLKYSETPTGRVVGFPGGHNVLTSLRKLYGNTLKVLVVEGAASTGQTFTEFRAKHQKSLLGWDVRFAVLYASPLVSAKLIEFTGMNSLEPWPEKFPWHARPIWIKFLRGSPTE